MTALKVRDVSAGAQLLKALVDRADINKDGTLRSYDFNQLREHTPPGGDARFISSLMAATRRSIAMEKSAALPAIKQTIDDLEERVKAADVDGDASLSDAERKRLKVPGEIHLALFSELYAGKTISSFDLPAQVDFPRPRFNWSGPPAKVAESLLAAHADRRNDNFWPWSGTSKPSRYVVTVNEAREMIQALKPLFPSRQKAVLTELERRSQVSEFGCVSPTDAGKRELEAYAATLGLTLRFGQPAAPKMPSP